MRRLGRRLAPVHPLPCPAVSAFPLEDHGSGSTGPHTFDVQGWLTIGLHGHQAQLGESCISTGSLYLALCAFLPLGLGPNAAFWADEDVPTTQEQLWG